MPELFGTDGIRSAAGEYPLDPPALFRLGLSIASFTGAGSKILIGMDTRESGPEIVSWISGGLKEGRCNVLSAGVIPTPAISTLVAAHDEYDLGIVISASHNPFQDNGIKLFKLDGSKLSDGEEELIESTFFELDSSIRPCRENPETDATLLDRYVGMLLDAISPFPGDRNLRLVVDSANGATAAAVSTIFKQLPIQLLHTGNMPNGKNINDHCGSQYPESCIHLVKEKSAYAGICLDGDGDRLIFIDEGGKTLTGDHLLYAMACDLHDQGELLNNTIVATVMSNGGLTQSLFDRGISLLSCPVGDRNVWQTMIDHDAYLGGEQSGHIINRHWATSGDGLLNSLKILKSSIEKGVPISAIAPIPIFPQTLHSIMVREKRPVETLQDYPSLLSGLTRELNNRGRILVRYSGTEPKLRVMVEGEDSHTVERVAESLVNYFRVKLA